MDGSLPEQLAGPLAGGAAEVELPRERRRTTPVRRLEARDRWEYAAIRMASRLFGSMPRERALRAGAVLGSLFYWLDGPDRAVAIRNLQLAFPRHSPRQRRSILHRSCRNLGRMVAEFCHLRELRADTIHDYVSIEDPKHWSGELAAARQRGAVVLSAHFGSWELLAYAQALLGQRITLVHRPFRNPLVEATIDRVRSRAGMRVIAKKSAAREALRALQRREMVVIPADQNQTSSYGVFVEFFGVPACTTPGPARLAMLTGAPIYPVFIVREGETHRHRIVLLPEIEMVRTGNRELDIRTNTQRCTAVIEQMVRRHPDHWIWFHKRWKTRPPGQPRLY